MNNSENPNTVQPTENGVTPTVVPMPSAQPLPTVVPTANAQPLPTVVPTANAQPLPTVAPTVVPTAPVSNLENDPRSVGIDNTEFIHPEAFDKVATHKDDGSVQNEKLKKVEVEYTPPSKFKVGLMIFFLIFMIAFALFLPEITSFIEIRLANQNDTQQEKITNGRMYCSLSTNTTNLDKKHEFVFSFGNNELAKVEYTITTKGDPTLDATTLDEMAAVCKQLIQNTETINGISVRCNYSEGKLVEIQNYDLQNLDMSEVRSSFTEAGGTNLEYPYGQDMDIIERSMIASGYECRREY